MTIKKLTVAAAIAVGIATCSLNQAMAACPCTQQPVSQSPCAEPLPVITGPACPCTQTPKCNDCQKAFDDCDCQNDDILSDNQACAVCPGSGKPSRADMKQVYGYPNAIYGTNNYVGEQANSILSTENAAIGINNGFYGSAPNMNAAISGTTISSQGQITGAAAQLPCIGDDPTRFNGVNVGRNDRLMDGNGTPVDVQTNHSMKAIKKSMVPFDLKTALEGLPIGAAAPTSGGMFPDVPNSYWASCNIDKLAVNNVVVGYPDGMFRPGRDITRAEFATMLVKGFNLDDCGMPTKRIFSDVPTNNWANAAIAKAVDKDLLAGYPNGKFEPNKRVTRAEALTSIAKGMDCDMDKCKADEILSHYADGKSVPGWARIPIAKSLQNGALKDTPNPNMIYPNREATRADIASMLQTVRVALGYDTNPQTANAACPISTQFDKQAFVENSEVVDIPTLKIKMIDQLTAKSSHVGQYFRANTLEEITLNGVTYPIGSTVTGQVVEVIRPSGCNKGALKLSFTSITDGCHNANLPKQILQAQVNKSNQVNPVARLLEMPFTLAGSLVGVTGRTVGGVITNLGNAVENVSNDAGYTLGHIAQGKFGAAARSFGDGIWETVKAPVDVTRTALSGTMGLFQTTGDEFAYLVDPKGYKISAVNPREHLTIAFGCHE